MTNKRQTLIDAIDAIGPRGAHSDIVRALPLGTFADEVEIFGGALVIKGTTILETNSDVLGPALKWWRDLDTSERTHWLRVARSASIDSAFNAYQNSFQGGS